MLNNEFYSLLQETSRYRTLDFSGRTLVHAKKVPKWSVGHQKVDAWPLQLFLLHEGYFREWHILKEISNFVLDSI